jgi:hypothetical protein
LKPAITDILSRFYDYSSTAIHNGRFFDRIVAHQTLYFVNDLNLKDVNYAPIDFLTKLDEFLRKKKIRWVEDDPISRYGKYQSSSNKRIKKSDI